MGWYLTPDRRDATPANNGMVKKLCTYCGKPIGYGAKFYLLEGDRQAHALCEWRAADERTKAEA